MDSALLNQLTQANNDQVGQLGDQIGMILTFTTIFSLILTVFIVIMWVMALRHRRKVQNAILEIKDILVEMNEREKQRSRPSNNVLLASETSGDETGQTV